ncbi:MAG: peptidylprolyl isomerase [Planctomycetaceae bacterium]|jgi:cyclophilin family peptidyl-prolyl cis-trans isomerase|nr:peptidylprolyl isomerase [Planctomycetaceae bacterium]
MQQELDSEQPELNISILGVNEAGHESGNSLVIDGRDLPWLQDIDDNTDNVSDTWESWDVTFRDVIITSPDNEVVAVYNLTANDLANADNFAALKNLLIDAAGTSSAPSLELASLDDVTLAAGSPQHIALNGLDPEGGNLSFSVQSSDPSVTAEVLSGNRSLRMEVDDFGVMTFELFENRTPRATQRIIELAESGFYNDTTFHRVINNFMIQGGDPTGTGAGGSTLGDFDDQFDVDLQHNSPGLLSMAKAADDTNDSQFFITEMPTRHLDFNHSIFGLLTEGEDVRAQISDVATDGSDRPLTTVVLHEADIFEDTQNGVLVLSAPEGGSGSATVTVTVTDLDGNTAVQNFNVTVTPDSGSSSNSNPFLDDIDAVRMESDSAASFTLTAQDAESDSVEFLGETELTAILSPSQLPNLPTGLDYTVDSMTGEVTITASPAVVPGEYQIRVGVRTPGTTGGDNSIDSQLVDVTIGVVTIDADNHSSGNQAGNGSADTLTVIRSGTDLQISVNGEIVRTIDESLVHAIDLVGSDDDDTFVIDCGNGFVEPTGGIVIRGGGEQTAGDSLVLQGASVASVTHRFESSSSGSVQIETNPSIVYSELEPISDSLGTTDRIFEFGDGADAITLGNDGNNINGISRISSTASSETVDFQNPTGSLIVRTGGGNDVVTASDLDPFGSPALSIDGEAGDDSVDASALTVPITLSGGSGDDSLTGGSQDDKLNGQSGDDVLQGSAGADWLFGGAGKDQLDGDSGNDRLWGQGYSEDVLISSSGADSLSGGEGVDRLSVSSDSNIALTDTQLTVGGETHLLADVEQAELSGGPAANTLDAAAFAGDTTLSGGGGADTISGSLGITLLQASRDEDLTLTDTSLAGSDTVTISDIDRARLIGGPSANALDVSAFSGPATLRGSAGNDTITGGESDDLIIGGTGSDVIEGRGGDDDIRAGSGDDTIDGGNGNDSIRAAAGHDSVRGSDGDDTLNGANGRDTLEGGTGNDALSGLAGADYLNGGDGTDTLIAGANHDKLFGGSEADILIGGDGNDTLHGQGGPDTVAGNDGSDDFADLVAGEADETFSFYNGWIDRI